MSICRCGVELPDFVEESADGDAPAGRLLSPANLVAAAVLLAAIAGAGYWALSNPPPATTSTPAATGFPSDGGGFIPAPPTPAGQATSVERRAWDAGLATADARVPDAAEPPREPVTAAPMVATAASLEDVVGRVMPAVVLVETSSGRGSGFFVRPDTIITNVHVVKDDGFVTLHRTDGSKVSARVDLKAPAFDIAILRVTPVAGQPVIPMGSADTLRPGQEVIVIGSALGTLQNSVSRGIVSGVRRSGEATLVQTDAAANPGNSGGPMLDRNGVAIGITTMGYRGQQGLNFAVAIDHARAIIEGRVASSTSAPLAMNDLKTLSPAVAAESDRVRDDGERAFLTTMTRMSRAADSLDDDWQRFRQSCYSSAVAGSYTHEWFVMLSPRAITSAQAGGGSCGSFLMAFQKEASRIGAEMRSALENARRAGVLPGVVRDALRENRLEFDGWDR